MILVLDKLGEGAGHWPHETNLAVGCGFPRAVGLRAGVEKTSLSHLPLTFPFTRSCPPPEISSEFTPTENLHLKSSSEFLV